MLGNNEQTGDGLMRDATLNPPPVRKILQSIGNEKIQSIQLIRTPLSKISRFLLNIASLGQLESKLKETNIDQLFHLSLLINGKYELDKQDVIKLIRNQNAVKSDSETLIVPVSSNITINELLENTQRQIGSSYAPYDAVNNNCSIFISNVLSSNGLSTDNSDTFLNQKTIELFSKFPSITEKIVKLGTDLGAVVDRAIYGEGEMYIHNFGLPRCTLNF